MVITKVQDADILAEYLKIRQKKRIKLKDFVKRIKAKKKQDKRVH